MVCNVKEHKIKLDMLLLSCSEIKSYIKPLPTLDVSHRSIVFDETTYIYEDHSLRLK